MNRARDPEMSFNPCFNGFMDKDACAVRVIGVRIHVSTLVLMDSWIKTRRDRYGNQSIIKFQPLF